MGTLEKERRFREGLLEWGEENIRDFPWREQDRTFYEVFIAEFFLTQTPADNVARVYPEFLSKFPDLNAIEAARTSELAESIEPIGFHNMRAAALTEIASSYDDLPRTSDGLQKLPRVGTYVANATVCFTGIERVPILDRNVRRVYRRVFGEEFQEATNEEEFAWSILPDHPDTTRTYNLALLDFGAAVCRKPEPDCESCFASRYCAYYTDGVNTRDFSGP